MDKALALTFQYNSVAVGEVGRFAEQSIDEYLRGYWSTVDLANLNIAIVGLGLMGGSLALSLRGSVGRLTGIDIDPQTRDLALDGGIVDAVAPSMDEGISSSDMVVLAVPVRRIVTMLQELPQLRPGGCMVLDLGSTKNAVGQAMERLPERFSAIGGHPMCGREKSGLGVASATLYQGQTFILCRNRRTTPLVEENALALVRAIGSSPLFMLATNHDQLVATSSHLPYLVASVLMRRAWSVAEQDGRLWSVSASGLYDTTRLAGSEPQMMLEILLANRQEILRQVVAYGKELEGIADMLRNGDEETLYETLKAAQKRRNEYLRQKGHQQDN